LKAEVIAGCDDDDASEDSDHTIAKGRKEVGVGSIGIDEEGGYTMITAEAASDE